MTAIFATLLAPTVARARSQRSAAAVALLCAALAASACGGLSVHHDDSDAGSAAGGTGGTSATPGAANGTGKPSPTAATDDSKSCANVCQACLGTAADNCATFCSGILDGAQRAGCSSALSNLLRCRDLTGSSCSVEECPAQNNALSVCVLDYCDEHVNDPICVAPL